MPINETKIIEIILDECQKIDEKCEGYRDEVIEVVSEIITYERQHRVQGTNIQQKIEEKCNATGRFLAENRKSVED